MTAANPDALDLMADGALGVAEAVEFTGLSRAELYRLMLSGRLVFVKHGRRTLIPKRAAVRLLAANVTPSSAGA